MKTLESAVTAAMIPIGILNMFGGLISGVWLLFLGEWGVIIFGLLSPIVGAMTLGILLLPGVLLSSLALKGGGNNPVLKAFLGIPATVYNHILMGVWAMACFMWALSSIERDAILPTVIWAYGMATGPWIWMAQKDNNEMAMVSVMGLQIACFVAMLSSFVTDYPGIVFVVMMIVMVCLQVYLLYTTAKAPLSHGNTYLVEWDAEGKIISDK